MSIVNNKIIADPQLEIGLSPVGLTFGLNKIQIGSALGQVMGLIQYHQESDYGWLSNLITYGTVTKVIYVPQNESNFISSLSRNIRLNMAKINSSNDPVEIASAERKVETYEKVLDAISRNNESVGMIMTMFLPTVTDENEFKNTMSKLIDVVTASKCKIRVSAGLQEQGFKTVSPYWTYQKEISEVFGRVSLLSAFFGGLPFTSDGFNDGRGYYFAQDVNHGLIILDTWKRSGSRTNSNWTVLGKPGSGKSTCLKHLILNEFALNTKILIIDPEAEYGEITKALKGDVIDAAGGSNGLINPLQIRPVPMDEDEDNEKIYVNENSKMGDMSLHLKTLEVFFKLYLEEIGERLLAILLAVVEELYFNFGINWDTDVSNLSNADFPIMSDLYELLVQKSKDIEPELRVFQENDYESLAILLRSMAVGADSVLFNGHTTLESSADVICLDTFNLQNTSDKIHRTQYYNLLTWCWQKMSFDRNEKTLLVTDEAYLMIDPDIKESLLYLRNISKRGRKYSCGLVVASHSVVDFLDPKIKMYGQALLNLGDYKVLFGSAGSDVTEVVESFKLKETHGDILRKNIRGMGLLVMGNIILQFNQMIPEHEWKYFGVRGGK